MKIHFVGIGGIGVSALAQYYLEKGDEVSGSDLSNSETLESLKKDGAKIKIGEHKKSNLEKGTDLVVFSPAVKKDNPEIKETKKRKIKCQSYPQALGELTKKHFTIAVSGTHGKSTTTAMIALILVKAGFDPTVIIGTKLKEFGQKNFRLGKSKYLVIEADEWQASFLNYFPKIIVLTNIEKEHLDYFKNLDHILKTYTQYINHLPKDGVLVANGDDKNIKKIIFNFQIKKYSLKQKEAKKIKKILKIPGIHNVSNALAALATARTLNIPDKISFQALSEYKGSWRRFDEKDVKINAKKIKIISDYGHHPTEIDATLKAAKEKFKNKKIWCVFQPHQYQRTYYLFDDFIKVFQKNRLDKIIITDIFDVAGREKGGIKKKINSQKLVEKISRKWVQYLPYSEIINYLKNNARNNQIVIMMGAGDIYNLLEKISNNFPQLDLTD